VFRDYVESGFALCGISRGKKAPEYDQWNERPVPAEAAEGLEGAGLLHALSGTAALDIDSEPLAREWLAERGVDLEALLNAPNAVRIDSGRYQRAKLLYRLRKPLRTLKPPHSGLELRCATANGKSVQDVLPPSIHPQTGKPYRWLYPEPLIGDWRSPPPIPATLLAAWRQLLADTLNCNLSVLPQANASARGAALLGGMAAGHWRQPDLAALALAANTVVQPHAGAVEAAALGYHRFLAVYGRLADGP